MSNKQSASQSAAQSDLCEFASDLNFSRALQASSSTHGQQFEFGRGRNAQEANCPKALAIPPSCPTNRSSLYPVYLYIYFPLLQLILILKKC